MILWAFGITVMNSQYKKIKRRGQLTSINTYYDKRITALVAKELGWDFIGFELNGEYIHMQN